MSIDVERLYRSHGPVVLRRCRHMLREEASAREVMHDVFVELLRRRNTLDDRGLTSLLLTMATNLCLNRIRTRGRRPEHALSELLVEISTIDGVEDRTLARRALDRLFRRHPSDSRIIATLHFVDGLTHEEVADEVGMSVSGVRKRLRSLRRLAALGEQRTDLPGPEVRVTWQSPWSCHPGCRTRDHHEASADGGRRPERQAGGVRPPPAQNWPVRRDALGFVP